MNAVTGNELRAQAEECDARKEASFESCDTDGFLSQWANGLTAQKLRLAAEIADNNGLYTFPALCRLSDGKRVRAKIIDTHFGCSWAFCDATGAFTGHFLGAFPVKAKTMAKKGYVETEESVPAYAGTRGNGGTGLAGATSVRVVAIRSDGGYPDDAVDY